MNGEHGRGGEHARDGGHGGGGGHGERHLVGRRFSAALLLAIATVLVATMSARATEVARYEFPSAQAPKRIISIVPAVTEMLFAIGAGNEVVGVSSYDRFPPEAATRPKVGALIDPDFERILSLKPDLVVVYGSQNDLIARLGRARLPMFSYQHAGLADITVTIRALGARIGRVAEAEKVAAAIEGDVSAIRQAVSGRTRPKTALVFGREPGTLRSLYVSAGVGFMHDMLEAAGGTDVFADVKRQSLQATTELLLSRAPDVIIEAHAEEGWTTDRLNRERDVWRALPSLPAVRSSRIYILADDRLSIPGPRVADAIRVLARVLHPDAFQIKASTAKASP
jgi:iron complex transport system substrate-binding protein